MTRFNPSTAAPLVTLAIALVMPLIVHVTPPSAAPLPTPLAAQATIGVPPSQPA